MIEWIGKRALYSVFSTSSLSWGWISDECWGDRHIRMKRKCHFYIKQFCSPRIGSSSNICYTSSSSSVYGHWKAKHLAVIVYSIQIMAVKWHHTCPMAVCIAYKCLGNTDDTTVFPFNSKQSTFESRKIFLSVKVLLCSTVQRHQNSQVNSWHCFSGNKSFAMEQG